MCFCFIGHRENLQIHSVPSSSTEVFTLPAGTDGELSFDLGGVQWVVLRNQEGLKGSSVHKQGHGGELHIQHVVMPLFVTHLDDTRADGELTFGPKWWCSRVGFIWDLNCVKLHRSGYLLMCAKSGRRSSWPGQVSSETRLVCSSLPPMDPGGGEGWACSCGRRASSGVCSYLQ